MDDSTALALPPAIDPAEREALLAQLVKAFKDDQGQPIAQSAAQALKLARELGRLLDELAIDGIAFDSAGNLWITELTRNSIWLITPEGRGHLVFDDPASRALLAQAEPLVTLADTPLGRGLVATRDVAAGQALLVVDAWSTLSVADAPARTGALSL